MHCARSSGGASSALRPFARSAAFVALAHKMDLFLSTGADAEYAALHRSDQMDLLDVPADKRSEVLEYGRTAFHSGSNRSAAA